MVSLKKKIVGASLRKMTEANVTLDPLDSIYTTIAFSSRDMSACKRDAWIYGIVLGWDESIKEIAEKHNWSEETIKRLKTLHDNFNKLEKQSKKDFGEQK